MIKHFKMRETAEDLEYKIRYEPIRTEILEYVFEAISIALSKLEYARNKGDYIEMNTQIEFISNLHDKLNQSEQQLINEISKDASAPERRSWRDSYRDAGIGSIREVKSYGEETFKIAMHRWKAVFDLDNIVKMKEWEQWYSPETLSTRDIPYHKSMADHVNRIVDAHIMKIDAQTDIENAQARIHRVCDKCGTEFQLSKSRNMHRSKCNGIKKEGIITPKVQNGRESEW